MSDGIRRRLLSTLPPIAWRDVRLMEREAQVRELRERVDRLQRALAAGQEERPPPSAVSQPAKRAAQDPQVYRGPLGEELIRPSFRRQLLSARQTTPALRRLDPTGQHPFRQIPFKLRNYRLGASHDVPVPNVLKVWSRPSDMRFDHLPDTFVVKSDRGASSAGVLPLSRAGQDSFRVVGGARHFTTAQIREHFTARASLGGPYFVEELLRQEGLHGDALLDDVKVYAFYGHVGHILLRRPAEHGRIATMGYRYVDENGSDLGRDIAPTQRINPEIPLPANFERIIAVARHLSSAVPLPFIRVDVYDTVDGPVLGELTRTPGGRQVYRHDHDTVLGSLWDEARIRVEVDIQSGRPPFTLHGSRDVPTLYPEDHASRTGARSWTVHAAPCEQWCAR